MDVTIRPERPGDEAAIAELTRAAFFDHPHSSHNEAEIIAALRDSGALSVSLVAVWNDRVIGHVAVSPVSISDGTGGWYGLGPVAVVPEQQGRGTGQRLVREALDRIRESGGRGCVVLGEPEYYGRFGFQVDPSLQLPGVPPEYFLMLNFYDRTLSGNATYHPAFDTTPNDEDAQRRN